MKPLTPDPAVLALRTGINLPAWVGMMKQGTPASVPQHACTHLENVYFLGGRILSRAGQAKVNDVPTDGCIEGLFDAGDTGAPPAPGPYNGMWIVARTSTDAGAVLILVQGDSTFTIPDGPESYFPSAVPVAYEGT